MFGIFLANVNDKEMDQFFIISMILAARSIWLHGNRWKTYNSTNTKKVVYEFHTLGNLVGIAIMGKVAKGRSGLDIENYKHMKMINQEIIQKLIEILENLQEHDDGTLLESIAQTISLILYSEVQLVESIHERFIQVFSYHPQLTI